VTAADAAELSGQIAAAARSVEGVADLHGGTFGEIGTYVAGGRVAGIRIADGLVEVHVTLYWGCPIRATADAVRSAVQPLVDRPVHVTVQDLAQRGAAESQRAGDPPAAPPPVLRRSGAGRPRKENS
jgi:uncharacterized alkaline shock family protein YloU